ncbi:aromatic-ring hydroxylase C-terminal domain-containing protein [Streptomyces caniscabiei]|uniref:aromatic-ring hydroxylase C-terminal domain-containing protein n=1 Tax=Streptomyces caniscabiei TaxID=2746961 RepID=UPI0038D48099
MATTGPPRRRGSICPAPGWSSTAVVRPRWTWSAGPVHADHRPTRRGVGGSRGPRVGAVRLAHRGIEDDGCLLVRPDGHIAWRARSGPAPDALLDAVARMLGIPAPHDGQATGKAVAAAAH